MNGKFRVWDKFLKKFVNDRHDYLTHSDGTLRTWRYSCYAVNPDDYIVQFFTGLQDKNGKDIYDGDIVRWEDDDFPVSIVEWGVDKYDYPAFDLEPACIDDMNSLQYGVIHKNLEIIGNIYQNPELLK